MKTIPAYFDGTAVRTADGYRFKKDQQLIITVLDDAAEGSGGDADDVTRRLSLLDGLQKYRGRMPEGFDAEKELAEAREQKHTK